VETKSGIILPPCHAVPAPASARELTVPQFATQSGSEAAQKHRNSVKTVVTPCDRRAGSRAEPDPLPLRKHRSPDDRRRRTVSGRVGRPEPETVSLSHYYRRHQHRARNHSRAMRQVAEWIENAGVVDSGAAKDAAVARRRKHARRHVHEHRHYHYHYHYPVTGVV